MTDQGAMPAYPEWRPIESAPLVASLLDFIPPCLVYSKEFGVQMGRAWRYANGDACGQGSGFNGEWNVTHWMPLPAPPPLSDQPTRQEDAQP